MLPRRMCCLQGSCPAFLLNFKLREPSGEWPFEAAVAAFKPPIAPQRQGTVDPLMVAELRVALSLAKRLAPGYGFYAELRNMHAAMIDMGLAADPSRTYQGDGYRVFRRLVDALSTLEVQHTKRILCDSVGYSLMLDGSNKGALGDALFPVLHSPGVIKGSWLFFVTLTHKVRCACGVWAWSF